MKQLEREDFLGLKQLMGRKDAKGGSGDSAADASPTGAKLSFFERKARAKGAFGLS
jgi:hypothetical protein